MAISFCKKLPNKVKLMSGICFQTTLFVGVCVTKNDWLRHQNSLKSSFEHIAQAWGNQVLIFLVVQGDKKSKTSYADLPDYVSVFETEFMGISRARNICIEKAIFVGAEFILFHDASIYWPMESADFIACNRYHNPKIKVRFSDCDKTNVSFNKTFINGDLKKINPIYDTYVWSYLFKVLDIGLIRFDENFGPGQLTRFKSGEDVLFLFEYFSKKNYIRVLEASAAYVYHPARSASYEKHLTYAKGQGKMFRVLLKQHPSFLLYRDFFLFLGNAVMRCLLGKPNSYRILRQRFIGFFDRGI